MHLWARASKAPIVESRYASLNHFFADYAARDFQIRFWDGSTWGAQRPRFTLVIRRPGTIRTLLLNPSELGIGAAYVNDDFDIEGDIEGAFNIADYILNRDHSFWGSFDHAGWLRKIPGKFSHDHEPAGELTGAVHSKSRDRQAISYHYDLPTDFYKLWLDRQMIYSCAFFQTPDDDLETAQEHKLDYICKKLRLRPGERLLDIGCGWGALVIHAVRHYGVQAVGITLSVPQAEVARQRIREAGIGDLCRIEVWDYRDLEASCQYDKIVSVGMFEHVGEALLGEYFRRAFRLLRPGGVFLNHGIAYSATYHRNGPSFIDRYVFPDGDIVPISTSLRAAEFSGFEVRDVESLREHYVLTLRHWLQRLEANQDEARGITNDATYRIWRLYTAGSAHGFQTGRMNLYQALLAKPERGLSGLPLTRKDWYCKE